MIQNIGKLWSDCRSVRASFALVLLRHLLYRALGKNLFTSNGVKIYGLRNIEIGGRLKVGLGYVGFMDATDRTLLRVRGQLKVKGNFSIGKGCRVDVGENASVTLHSGYINPSTKLVIMHGLTVGEGCAISWDCQLIDEDFHALTYPNKVDRELNSITVGDHVWVGSKVTILKGSFISSGSVVAAGSVVSGRFEEENVLIAGIPAKVIRRGIHWQ